MKTISSKVSENEFEAFSQYAKENNMTISRLIRKLLYERSLTSKSNYDADPRKEEPSINHVLSCSQCQIALADKGFIIMTTKTYQKVRKYI